jgi:chromatin remodeling complex protein RSC6
MVRAAKTSADKAPATPVVPSATKSKKTKAVEVVVSETPVDTAPVVAPVDGEVVESNVTVKLAEYSDKITQLTTLASSLKAEFKALEKSVAKELKAAQKASQKKKRASGNRAPSGFVKPTLISDELAAFLGKEKGTLLARTAVSKEINAYIRSNKLQDDKNGRKIHPDAKLAKLLKLSKTDELTYFNLQKYMKHHFPKAVVAVATV